MKKQGIHTRRNITCCNFLKKQDHKMKFSCNLQIQIQNWTTWIAAIKNWYELLEWKTETCKKIYEVRSIKRHKEIMTAHINMTWQSEKVLSKAKLGRKWNIFSTSILNRVANHLNPLYNYSITANNMHSTCYINYKALLLLENNFIASSIKDT